MLIGPKAKSRSAHELAIASIRQPSKESIALTFKVPEELRSTFQFRPGQYLTLAAVIDGVPLRRCYSICSRIGAKGLEVGIRQVESGRFSNHVSTLRVGDRLSVLPPDGRFGMEMSTGIGMDTGGYRDSLLIAAGSGITPCLSIITSMLERVPASRVTLLYGNRSIETAMFRADLDALKDRFTERFMLIHVLSREPDDVPLLQGRLDGEKLRAFAQRGLIEPTRYDDIHLCGPAAMMKEAIAALEAQGVERSRLHLELFATKGSQRPHPSAASLPSGEAGARVDIILDGIKKRIHVDGGRETVLAAARRQGLDLPHACTGGMCCTCRCKVLEGKSAMDVNYALEPWELEAGFTLACQTRPRSSSLVLDFDAH